QEPQTQVNPFRKISRKTCDDQDVCASNGQPNAADRVTLQSRHATDEQQATTRCPPAVSTTALGQPPATSAPSSVRSCHRQRPTTPLRLRSPTASRQTAVTHHTPHQNTTKQQ